MIEFKNIDLSDIMEYIYDLICQVYSNFRLSDLNCEVIDEENY